MTIPREADWPVKAETGCYPLVSKDGEYIGEWHTDGRVVLYAGWWEQPPGDVIAAGDNPLGLDIALSIRSNAAEVAAKYTEDSDAF